MVIPLSSIEEVHSLNAGQDMTTQVDVCAVFLGPSKRMLG
jgi:hypothetical protein